jgi:hypothetical protein
MTPYGRREAWEDDPEGWPEAPEVGAPVGGHGAPICWYWRSDADGNATWGPTSRPVPQWTRPGATPSGDEEASQTGTGERPPARMCATRPPAARTARSLRVSASVSGMC